MSVHHAKLAIRIMVVGAKGCGKSTLVKSYIGEETSNSDAAYMFDAVIENRNLTQQILDSNGKSKAVTAWAHGIMVVFAVDNKKSLKEAEKYIEQTKQLTMKNGTIMLVANKVDIENRTVSMDEGQKLAAKYNCTYKEVSALSYNKSIVESTFYELSHEIIDSRGFLRKYSHGTPTMVRRLFKTIAVRKAKKAEKIHCIILGS